MYKFKYLVKCYCILFRLWNGRSFEHFQYHKNFHFLNNTLHVLQACKSVVWRRVIVHRPALLDIPTMLFLCFQKLMSFLNARKSNKSWTKTQQCLNAVKHKPAQTQQYEHDSDNMMHLSVKHINLHERRLQRRWERGNTSLCPQIFPWFHPHPFQWSLKSKEIYPCYFYFQY